MEHHLINRLETRIKALQTTCEQLQRENQQLQANQMVLIHKNNTAIATIEKIIQQLQLIERPL